MSGIRDKLNRLSRGIFYVPLHTRIFLILITIFVITALLLFLGVVGTAFRALFPELGVLGTFLLLTGCLFGSYINIPITKLKSPYHTVRLRYITVFGITYPVPALAVEANETLLSINLGGAVIPAIASLYLVARSSSAFSNVLIATLFVSVVVKIVSRPVRGLGIVTPYFIPPLTAAFSAILLGDGYSPIIAYAAGTLGTLIGADLLNLNVISKLGSSMVSIGGAGTFDGVFLTGIMAVLIAF